MGSHNSLSPLSCTRRWKVTLFWQVKSEFSISVCLSFGDINSFNCDVFPLFKASFHSFRRYSFIRGSLSSVFIKSYYPYVIGVVWNCHKFCPDFLRLFLTFLDFSLNSKPINNMGDECPHHIYLKNFQDWLQLSFSLNGINFCLQLSIFINFPNFHNS